MFLSLAGSKFLILAQCEKNFHHTYKVTDKIISRNVVPWEFSSMYACYEKYTKIKNTYCISTGAHTSTLYKIQPNLFS